MAFKLLMFSDFICPFCYIGFETVRKLQPEFGFELEWKGFQIHPEWPAEGVPASEYRRGMDPETRRVMWARIAGLGEVVGLPMRSPEILANSRLALEATEFALENGRAEAFERHVYEGYFKQGLNISKPEVLSEIAEAAGLDPSGLMAALESNRYSARLRSNAELAHERGVDGVPTFFVGNYPMVGAQGEEVMRQILRRYVSKLATA
jgi:predicted DsbA family dithiol-disulfide isomerase